MDAMMVAQGQAEAWIESTVKPWDLAAVKIITEEAGGQFFDFTGKSTINGGNAVACVPALAEEIRRFLSR
jgi:fructose-1,6-bisphosphatase/inositol monophosphatase family enzyme